jgi:hypothetical protein
MKPAACNLITEDFFWELIAKSNFGDNLTDTLAQLTEKQLIGYSYWFSYYLNKSYDQALWAAAYVVFGGCSDDAFEYFRAWLLFQGKDILLKALAEPDSLCDHFSKLTEDEYPAFEDAFYIPYQVFKDKFNKDFYETLDDYDFKLQSLPDLDFAWSDNEGDEQSIRKVCPKTFDKWWGNDKF